MGMLARLLENTGNFIDARLLLGRAYAIAAKSLGQGHPTTLNMKAQLNGLLMNSPRLRAN